MSGEIDFKFIGWHSHDGHDKVWSWFTVDEHDYYCAWGRRGKKLQFKKHGNKYTVQKLQAEKLKKGYKPTDDFILFSMFPDFKEDLEQQLVMEILSGTIR